MQFHEKHSIFKKKEVVGEDTWCRLPVGGALAGRQVAARARCTQRVRDAGRRDGVCEGRLLGRWNKNKRYYYVLIGRRTVSTAVSAI